MDREKIERIVKRIIGEWIAGRLTMIDVQFGEAKSKYPQGEIVDMALKWNMPFCGALLWCLGVIEQELPELRDYIEKLEREAEDYVARYLEEQARLKFGAGSKDGC